MSLLDMLISGSYLSVAGGVCSRDGIVEIRVDTGG